MKTVLIMACALAVALGIGTAGAAEKPAVFAVGFTDITNDSAVVAFSTLPAAAATVTLQAADEPARTVAGDKNFTEIHRVKISGLTAGKTYAVSIKAEDESKTSVLAEGYSVTIGLRPRTFAKFEGRMFIGSGWPHNGPTSILFDSGAGVARIAPTWDGIEPRPGQFNERKLSEFKAAVQELVNKGVEPVVLLGYAVDWEQVYTDKQMIWRNPNFGPPDYLENWKAYVRKVMEEVKGLATYYEVWNEPDAGYLASGVPAERLDTEQVKAIDPIYRNNNEYWLGDRFVPMVMAVREVADSIDENIVVMGPSWNHDYHGNRGDLCFDRGMDRYIQMYSFHNYGPPIYGGWEFWTRDKYFFHADRIFEKHNIDMPVAITEWNIPTYDQPDKSKGQMSRRDGQIFLLKSTFLYLSLEKVSIIILHQLGYNTEWALVWKNKDGSLNYTPNYRTFQWLCKTFSGKRYEKLDVKTTGDENVRAYAIHLLDNDATYLALWQDRWEEAKRSAIPLPAQQIKFELPLPDGKYSIEKLDVTGNVQAVSTEQITGKLSQGVTLPESNAVDQSDILLFRLKPGITQQ